MYTGKAGDTSEENVGARVIKYVSNDVLYKGLHLYLDANFPSPTLLSDLLVKNTFCIGMLRVHRKHFPKYGKQRNY